MDVFDVIQTSIGGMDVDTTIEGRERYKINVRYPRELREDIDILKKILIPIPKQRVSFADPKQSKEDVNLGRVEHVPLELLGEIKATMGPSMIKDEMGSLTGWVYIDTIDEDIGGYVTRAKKAVARKLKLPKGYFLKWTGQYEYLERMQALMRIAIPLTLLIIAVILFLNFGGLIQMLIVMLSVPCAALGAIWLLFVSQYNMSVAVWVGLIALLGIAAETVSIMMVYLDEGFREWSKEGRIRSKEDLITMVVEHGSARVRPVLMAVGLNIIGLVPIMFATGVGSDVAKRISAPLWGGLITLTILTLIIIPAVYVIWRGYRLPAKAQ